MLAHCIYVFYCFTVHFNSLNDTHQLMHFQYNNILVYNVNFKTLNNTIIYNKPTRCNSGSIVFINNYK